MRVLVEKPISGERVRNEASFARAGEVAKGGAGRSPSEARLLPVAKPDVAPTPGLDIDRSQLKSPLPCDAIVAEHESAQKLLDASYVLETAGESGE